MLIVPHKLKLAERNVSDFSICVVFEPWSVTK